MDTLMIVESPKKAKLIGQMLAKDGIQVMATFGHIRELDISKPRGEVVDTKHNFKMAFRTVKKKHGDVASELVKAAKKAKTIYLASDNDLEGESIAYHVVELLKERGVKIDEKIFKRVTYLEITEKIIREAIENYREIDMNKVKAQWVRQALDFLVGFYISPILWKIIVPGLSAGRVQSPALHMLTQREKEISAFVSTKYYDFMAKLNKSNEVFNAKLHSYKGEVFKPQSIDTLEEANRIHDDLDALWRKEGKMTVKSVNSRPVSTKPKPPYTTSTLQQDAIRKYGFDAQRAMRAAQKCYEAGLITYHRTDSTNLSEEALKEIIEYGKKNYPKETNEQPTRYQTKSKNAQEAHEAIRPTSIGVHPNTLKSKLDPDEYKLYEMVWQRTMACQMKPFVSESTRVDLTLGDYIFKANGSVPLFLGFRVVYQEGNDIDKEKNEEDNKQLPKMAVGDKPVIDNITKQEKETKPPARFNEATLVKALEEYGIGRPSTYATIPATLKERKYIEVSNSRITVTQLGIAVSDYLEDKFSTYIDYEFTSKMEDSLDEVARGEVTWTTVLHRFWNDFKEVVKKEENATIHGKGVLEETALPCPKCNRGTLNIRIGSYGRYYACSRYKECDYKESIDKKPKAETEVVEGKLCPECNSQLVYRKSKKGSRFIGCSNYPTCKYAADENGNQKPKSEMTGVKCPKCKKKELVIRQGRMGKFIACSGFPKCRHVVREEEFASISGKNVSEVHDMLGTKPKASKSSNTNPRIVPKGNPSFKEKKKGKPIFLSQEEVDKESEFLV